MISIINLLLFCTKFLFMLRRFSLLIFFFIMDFTEVIDFSLSVYYPLWVDIGDSSAFGWVFFFDFYVI